MKTSLPNESANAIASRLAIANAAFVARYPGESAARQPCHVIYVGAHDFHETVAREWADTAMHTLDEHAADASSLAEIVGLPCASAEDRALAETIRARVVAKLRAEAVEDMRVDFEDGYGVRPDAEEDAHVEAVAAAMARGMSAGTLPPFIGIRVKPLNEDVRARSVRTTDGFLSTLAAHTGKRLPSGFCINLAKVTNPEQVAAFADLLDALERSIGFANGSLVFEIMIEVAQAVIGPRGEAMVPLLVEAGRGRCIAAHLGTYDFTASCGITAAHQSMAHPACDFAKQVILQSLAGRGVAISDGATHIVPVGDRDAIRSAWRRSASDIRRSLVQGYYQGWDMHPAQLPIRYAALYAFFLEALPKATARMKAFLSKATHASGDASAGVLDDAATGQALLNFFLRGMSCGAITDDEALATDLTLDEIRGRSFPKILAARRA